MPGKRVKILLTVVVGACVIGGGVTFFNKLWEFVQTANMGEMTGFAVVVVIPYLLGAVGFLFLIFWSFLKGHYRNIEQPKYRMLEDLERHAEVKGI